MRSARNMEDLKERIRAVTRQIEQLQDERAALEADWCVLHTQNTLARPSKSAARKRGARRRVAAR